MTIKRSGDEVAVFDPDPETLAYLTRLPSQGKTLAKAREWAEAKPGLWRISLSALSHMKVAA